ncbi:MAG: AAA family ATPase [Gammaproteobacteria bacterium]|nr:AAA family ATPase [Gammaproteobacteria bacterium]
MRQPILKNNVMLRLGLTTQPFKQAEECEELFHNTSSDMLINSIKQQLAANDKIQLVIGEYRSGKSCLCRRLLCEAPPELSICYYKAHKRPRIDDLFSALLSDTRLNGSSDAQSLAVQAAKRVFRQLRDNQQPVLLIDDAHLLTTPVLRMLFRFQDAISKQNRGKLKIALVGERQLQEKWHTLDNAAPADEAVYTSLIRPLNRQEITSYLDFRFALAGIKKNPFSDKQLQMIQKESAGAPGKIELLASDILNNGGTGFKVLSSPRLLMIAGAAIIIAAVATSYMAGWLTDSTAEKLPQTTEKKVNVDISVPDQPEQIAPAQSPIIETTTKTTTPTVKNSDWLNQWPDDYYVIQLVGSWQSEKLLQLAETLTLENELILHTSLRNDKTWYALLYGVFPDRDAARDAIQNLPTELRKSQPWPRPISTLMRN